MIKHIVLFKLKEENKIEFMNEVKKDLEDLVEKIDELKGMEIGITFLENENMPDLSLYSTFENEEGLAAYVKHPEHQKVVEKFKTMVISRSVVDYKI